MGDNRLVKMTDKQVAFVKHYLSNNYNAYQAALSAGYSEATAQSKGSEFLKHPLIKEAISQELSERSLQQEQVIERISQIALNKGAYYINPSTGEYDLERLFSDGLQFLIKSIHPLRDGRLKVELHDSYRALQDLLQVHKMIGTDVNIEIHNELSIDEQIRNKIESIRTKLTGEDST